ncbi:MAG: hypothetical protein FJ278_05085, partial [Planctomycetes bacterium]|nr:hypothetical protein [Planctomycetota bacterium]
VIWTRMLILIFGSTTFAISTVLTAFMAGLALGSFTFGRLIDRRGKPFMTYGLLELGIGAYALLAPTLFDSLVPLYREVWLRFEPSFFAFSLLRFALLSAILIVPTFLMGGTLPVLSRYCVRRADLVGCDAGTLYATNTFGAVLGTFFTGFVLLSTLGLRTTTLLAAATNLTLGLAVVLLSRATRETSAASAQPAPASPSVPQPSTINHQPSTIFVVLFCFAASGFAAMAYEVAWTRTLSLLLGSSTYAFTTMLTTFLIGLSVGSFVFARLATSARFQGVGMLAYLQLAIGILAFLTTFLFAKLPYTYTVLFKRWGAHANETALMALNFAIAGVIMLPATLFLGGMFPVVVRICATNVVRVGKFVGDAYSINTVGAILGSFCAGWLLIPTLGILKTLFLCVAINLILALVVGLVARDLTLGMKGVLCVMTPVLLYLVPHAGPDWNALLMTSGMYKYASEIEDYSRDAFYKYTEGDYDLLYYKEGITATVTLAKEKARDNIWLATNGKIDASSHADMPTQVLSGEIPLLLMDNPQDALVVGLASGVTVGSVLQHPVKSLTAVEIEPAIAVACTYFGHVNFRPWEDPRFKLVANDARNYLLVTPQQFDIIISEPSNPWMTGASSLFTQEFFKLGRSRLKPNGLFTQWLQLYGMAPPNVQALLRTFLSVFPHVLIFETIEQTDLILIGSERELTIDAARIADRMKAPKVQASLARVQVADVFQLLTYFKIGTKELVTYAGQGLLNTDDNELIELQAPKNLHANTRAANDRLLAAATAGILPYLRNYGQTDAERAAFLAKLAEANLAKAKGPEAARLAKASLAIRENPEARKVLATPVEPADPANDE